VEKMPLLRKAKNSLERDLMPTELPKRKISMYSEYENGRKISEMPNPT
jgi:hypothetical protein